jgi:uncharacterized delta-60 repeat protein
MLHRLESGGSVLQDIKMSSASSRRVEQQLVRAPKDLNAGFGDSGVVFTVFGQLARAHSVCVQRSGRIVVAGDVDIGHEQAQTAIALVRYDSDGTLDETFGNGGKVVFDHLGESARALAVGHQSDGRLVIAGGVQGDANTGMQFSLIRVTEAGDLDTTFGTEGIARAAGLDGTAGLAHSLLVLPDNQLLVAGAVHFASPLVGGQEHQGSEPSHEYLIAVRCQPDGSPDVTFGYFGSILAANGAEADISIAMTGQHSFVVSGTTNSCYTVTDYADPSLLYSGVIATINSCAKRPLGYGTDSMAQLVSHAAASDPHEFAARWGDALTMAGKWVLGGEAVPTTIADDLRRTLTSALESFTSPLSRAVIEHLDVDASEGAQPSATASSRVNNGADSLGSDPEPTQSFDATRELPGPRTFATAEEAALEFFDRKEREAKEIAERDPVLGAQLEAENSLARRAFLDAKRARDHASTMAVINTMR